MALFRCGGGSSFDFFLSAGQMVDIKDISTPSSDSISVSTSYSHTVIGNCVGKTTLTASTNNHVSVVGFKNDGSAVQIASSSSPAGPYDVSDYDFFFYTDYQTSQFPVTVTLA